MNLKKIRTEKGITIPKLVEQTGIPKRTVEDIQRRGDCLVSMPSNSPMPSVSRWMNFAETTQNRPKPNNPMPSGSFYAAGRFSYSTTIVLISSRL